MSKLFKRLQKQRQEKELEEMNVELEEEEEPQPQARNLFGAFAMGDSSDEDSFEKGEDWAETNLYWVKYLSMLEGQGLRVSKCNGYNMREGLRNQQILEKIRILET